MPWTNSLICTPSLLEPGEISDLMMSENGTAEKCPPSYVKLAEILCKPRSRRTCTRWDRAGNRTAGEGPELLQYRPRLPC